MIDRAGLAAADVHHEPFLYAVVRLLLSPDEAAELAADFPTDGFHLDDRSARSGSKRYRFYNLNAIVDSRWAGDSRRHLSAGWQAFVEELADPGYLESLGGLLGLAVGECVAEIRLCRYEAGCWIDPHTDRLDKRLTQTIYFTPGWQSAWGGSLLLLRSSEPSDLGASITPDLATSVVFAPSENSWHTVEPIREGAPAWRHSVLMHLTDRA